MDCGQSITSTELKEELTTSLTSFKHQDEHFTHRAAQRLEMEANESEYTNMFLFGLFGGAFGAVCGGVSGGIGGAMGAVGAATYGMISENMTMLGATVGFVGSIVGGAVGGAFGGTFGGAVGAAAAKTIASPGHIRLVSDVALVTFGCATGSAIGCGFHRTVGTIGGAAGASFGALVAGGLAAGLAGNITDYLGVNLNSVQPIEKLLLQVLKEQQNKTSRRGTEEDDEYRSLKTFS